MKHELKTHTNPAWRLHLALALIRNQNIIKTKIKFILFIFLISSSCTNSVEKNENSDIDKSQRKVEKDSVSSEKLELSTENNRTETKIEFVENFYEEYISELSEMPMDLDRIDSLEKKFLTVELYKKLKEQDLDYDPFLNAQDFDDDILEKLASNEHTEKKDVVKVSYIDDYTSSTVSIFLKVIELENGYKISSILNK